MRLLKLYNYWPLFSPIASFYKSRYPNHTPKGMTRRDGTVCARLRIGHSYLTHCYLLKGEPQPFCVSCNEALTINHLLTICAEFADSRRKHYSTNTLEEVLSSGNYAHVLSFLKEINLYKKV